MDAFFSSRYPFTSEAKELVSSRKGGLRYEEVEEAKRRVMQALSKGELAPVETKLEEVSEREVFSYAGARVIVACLQSRYFRGRYAVAESKRVGRYLRQEDDALISRVAREVGLNVHADSPYALKFTEYLKSAPKSVDYKLSNKRLSNGMVSLDRNQLIRVIEEAVRIRIEETLPIDVSGVPPELKKAAEEIKARLPKEEAFGSKIFLKEEDYPPCVKELLEKLRNSENLPHTARWFLAVFLLKSGMKAEDVIALFRTAPDYDEHTTRYQVEYIAKKGYKVPSCVSVDSYGFCVADCGIRNPISYKKRTSVVRGEGSKGEGSG